MTHRLVGLGSPGKYLFLAGMGLDVGDSLQDGLRDWWRSGQQVALGLVSVLVGLVAHTDVLALRGHPLEDTIDVSVDITGGGGSGSIVEDQFGLETVGVHIVDQLLNFSILVGGHQGGEGAYKQLDG